MQIQGWSNKLGRLTVDHAVISAQNLVSPHDFVQRAPERHAVKRAAETHRSRNVVCGRARFQLVKKPEALLRVRQQEIAITRHGNDRRNLQTVFST